MDTFISYKEGNSLADYIKQEAWTDDSNGETRVYLVRGTSEDIVLFFSIKCGLLVEESLNEVLSPDEQEFVDQVVDCELGGDNMRDYREALSDYGMKEHGYDKCRRLFDIARSIADRKQESIVTGQSQNTIHVHKCLPAIELSHLCRNEMFNTPEEFGNTPLGFGIFWEIIVPLVVSIAETVGCKYIYLFAADHSDKRLDNSDKKLISYYKNHFKFSECKKTFKFIKPKYDNYCYGLIQEVSEMKRNREAVWTAFSDIFSS